MKRIIQKLGMVVASLLSFLSASAYDFEVDGIYYNIVSLDELTCEVTKGGYDKKYVGDITIPSEVSYKNKTLSIISIGYGAFSECTGLTLITIPNSVTKIDCAAFMGCTGLTSIIIPNSVTEIGSNAFYGCTGLTSVDIPNSVTEIDGAFSNCTGLTSVVIPNSVTEIGNETFSNCTGLTSVTIPNSVTKIGSWAFYDCTSLTSVSIPNSVTKIGVYAFEGCTGLTSITIPNSVREIGKYAFSDCTGLTSLEILASVTKLEHREFSECNSLESLTLPPSLVEISTDNNNASFLNCNNIKKLTILGDENVSKLTFKGTYYSHYNLIPFSNLKLEELYLGRVIRWSEGFSNLSLSELKKITFGKYLNAVGDGNDVYYKLSSIPTTAEIYCENPTPPSIGGNGFSNQQYISNVVYVPKESLEAYKQAEGWKNFWDIRAYDPASGIKDVSADVVHADVFKVYNLAGMLVKETADKTEAYDLPAGIYIINGRKVAIR